APAATLAMRVKAASAGSAKVSRTSAPLPERRARTARAIAVTVCSASTTERPSIPRSAATAATSTGPIEKSATAGEPIAGPLSLAAAGGRSFSIVPDERAVGELDELRFELEPDLLERFRARVRGHEERPDPELADAIERQRYGHPIPRRQPEIALRPG